MNISNPNWHSDMQLWRGFRGDGFSSEINTFLAHTKNSYMLACWRASVYVCKWINKTKCWRWGWVQGGVWGSSKTVNNNNNRQSQIKRQPPSKICNIGVFSLEFAHISFWFLMKIQHAVFLARNDRSRWTGLKLKAAVALAKPVFSFDGKCWRLPNTYT